MLRSHPDAALPGRLPAPQRCHGPLAGRRPGRQGLQAASGPLRNRRKQLRTVISLLVLQPPWPQMGLFVGRPRGRWWLGLSPFCVWLRGRNWGELPWALLVPFLVLHLLLPLFFCQSAELCHHCARHNAPGKHGSAAAHVPPPLRPGEGVRLSACFYLSLLLSFSFSFYFLI